MPPGRDEVQRLLRRGLNHYGAGDIESAVSCWKRTLKLDPQNGPARDYLASVRSDRKEGLEEPQELVEQGLEKYRAGDLEGAWDLLKSATRLSPDQLDIQGYLALVKEQLLERFAGELGDLGRSVCLAVPLDQLLERRLRPDQAYLLSRIDGAVTLDDLLSLCTGDRFESLHAIVELLREQLIVPA